MAKPTPEEIAAAKAAEDQAFAELEAAEAAAAEAAAAEAAAAEAAAAEAAAAEAAAAEAEPAADEDGKVLVETTGPFMLIDPLSGAEIEAEGSTLVAFTSFVEQRIELGQLKLAS